MPDEIEGSVDERAILLDFIMEEGVKYLNEEVNISHIVSNECGGEHRSAKFVIKGISERGMGLTDDSIVMIEEIDDPTCVITVGEDAFLSFATGRITWSELLFIEDTELEGDYAIREIDLFRRLFNTLREKWEDFGLKASTASFSP